MSDLGVHIRFASPDVAPASFSVLKRELTPSLADGGSLLVLVEATVISASDQATGRLMQANSFLSQIQQVRVLQSGLKYRRKDGIWVL